MTVKLSASTNSNRKAHYPPVKGKFSSHTGYFKENVDIKGKAADESLIAQ
jgi:hypothetical protein